MKTRPEVIHTDTAPEAIGPYSQAIALGDLVFVSGQIPLDPATGGLVRGSFADHTARVLANLDGILQAAGSDRSRVVKVTVYLTDVGRFAEFNAIYASFFGDHRPARAVVGVASLPRGAEVEIEALAAR
ncbi:MAG TPA: RidA family protein [Thermoanaerobaculaceae bacterium]|nr:RidA family protein [Thermoanaerobaculaceae bacterium]